MLFYSKCLIISHSSLNGCIGLYIETVGGGVILVKCYVGVIEDIHECKLRVSSVPLNSDDCSIYSGLWFIRQHRFPIKVSDKPGVG
jgi:hypothetical protein